MQTPTETRIRAAGVSAWLVAITSMATTGCFPEVFVDSEELDAIATVRAKGHDFSDYKTYALNPKLVDLSDLVEEPRDIPAWVQPTVLNKIAAEMAAQGYERVPYEEGTVTADVTMVAGAVSSDNWVLTGYYPWWPGYWWYYPVTIPVNYPSGSVIITMLRPQDAEETDGGRALVPAVWGAALRGLVTGSEANGTQRIQSGIAQAFKQSPYLKTGTPVEPVFDGGGVPSEDAAPPEDAAGAADAADGSAP